MIGHDKCLLSNVQKQKKKAKFASFVCEVHKCAGEMIVDHQHFDRDGFFLDTAVWMMGNG
jgi:hypothetical protein